MQGLSGGGKLQSGPAVSRAKDRFFEYDMGRGQDARLS